LRYSIKLNKLFFIIFLVVILITIIALITQYNFSKNLITENYKNKYKSESLRVREEIRHLFDNFKYTLQESESESIEKLNLLYELYKKNSGTLDIEKTVALLNEGLTNGSYQVLLINRDYVVESGSYKPDIGFNLGQFNEIKSVLQDIFDKKLDIHISSPRIETTSMSVKKYYIRLSNDGKYILQIAFVLNTYTPLKNKIHKELQNLKNYEAYVAREYYIHNITFDKNNLKKFSVKEGNRIIQKILSQLAYYSNTYRKRIYNILDIDLNGNGHYSEKKLISLYQDINDVISFNDIENKKMVFYSFSHDFFNEEVDMTLILKMDYDTKKLEADINSSFYTLIQIFIFTILFLSLVYLFILKNIIYKQNAIVKSIQDNAQSSEKNIVVNEIYSLQKSYNNLREQLNNELNKNKTLLEQNNRFIADTVHQIRTPLSVIMMNSDLIKMQHGNENYNEYIEQINASINMLTNSYEDLSYITSHDTIDYKPINCSISDILRTRVEFFNTIAKVNNKSISTKIEDNIYFNINIIELERLIDNNISNAIKYATENKEIKVHLHKKEKIISLFIHSYGDAIKDTNKLFEKNYREDEEKRGLGLGLNMVKTICEKYSIKYDAIYGENQNIFRYFFKI